MTFGGPLAIQCCMKLGCLILAATLAALAARHPNPVPPIDMAYSGRLESFLRGGRLYLSLMDCIALAIENNLDIAIERYGPRIESLDTAHNARAQQQHYGRSADRRSPVSGCFSPNNAGLARKAAIQCNWEHKQKRKIRELQDMCAFAPFPIFN